MYNYIQDESCTLCDSYRNVDAYIRQTLMANGKSELLSIMLCKECSEVLIIDGSEKEEERTDNPRTGRRGRK